MESILRKPKIGECLIQTLQEMKTKNMINEEAIEKVMGLYDKNIVAAIETTGQKNLKGTIKGQLEDYRHCDCVWNFVIRDAKISQQDAYDFQTIPLLKIIALEKQNATVDKKHNKRTKKTNQKQSRKERQQKQKNA